MGELNQGMTMIQANLQQRAFLPAFSLGEGQVWLVPSGLDMRVLPEHSFLAKDLWTCADIPSEAAES
jgi:hypothetical protein